MFWNEKRLLKVTGHFVPGTLYYALNSELGTMWSSLYSSKMLPYSNYPMKTNCH